MFQFCRSFSVSIESAVIQNGVGGLCLLGEVASRASRPGAGTENKSSTMAPVEEKKVENRGAHFKKENMNNPNFVTVTGMKPKKIFTKAEKKKLLNRGAHLRKADADKVPKRVYVPTGKPPGRPKATKE